MLKLGKNTSGATRRRAREKLAMGALLLLLLLPLGAMLAPSQGWAQVHTEQSDREAQQAGLSGSVAGTFALERGNRSFLSFGGSASVQHQLLFADKAAAPPPERSADTSAGTNGQPAQHGPVWVRQSVRLQGRGLHRSGDSGRTEAFAYAGYTRMFWRQLGIRAFAQFQYDQTTRLQRRVLSGVGPRWVALNTNMLKFTVGSAYMFEDERLTDTVEGEPPESRVHRWTNTLALRFTMEDWGFEAHNTTYVQPRFDKLADFRVLNTLGAEMALFEDLALTVDLIITHDSRPPSGVETTDVRLLNGVKLTF